MATANIIETIPEPRESHVYLCPMTVLIRSALQWLRREPTSVSYALISGAREFRPDGCCSRAIGTGRRGRKARCPRHGRRDAPLQWFSRRGGRADECDGLENR